MIGTERLLLRPFAEADFPAWRRIFADPAVIRTYGGGLYREEAEAREKFLAHALGNPKKYAIVRKEDGEVLGEINAADPNPWVAAQADLKPFRGVSLSFAVLPAFQGRGYASEAAAALVDFCFASGADYVNAGYFAGNLPSQKLQEKLGMTYYGAHTYTRNGETVDVTENILWRK